MTVKQDSSKQVLTELEFCLREYFKENFVPIIDVQTAKLEKNKTEEHVAHLEHNWMSSMVAGAAGPDGGEIAIRAQDDKIKWTGEWNQKSSDWLMKSCRDEFTKDKTREKDLLFLAGRFNRLFQNHFGEKSYKQINEELPNKNLGLTYIQSRLDEMFIEHLAEKKVPQSSLEYILKKGLSETFVGSALASPTPSSEIDEKIDIAANNLYNPSTTERTLAAGLSVATDVVSTGGTTSIAAFSSSVSVEVLARLLDAATSQNNSPREFTRQMSALMYNDEYMLEHLQASAQTVSPQKSEFVSHINKGLKNHLGIQAYIPQYSDEEKRRLEQMLKKASPNESSLLQNITKAFYTYNLNVNQQVPVAQWMKEKSAQDCYNLSLSFAAMAVEMKSKGKVSITIKNRTYTLAEVSQRAYDYARAANAKVQPSLSAHQDVPHVASSVHPSAPKASEVTPSTSTSPTPSNVFSFQPSQQNTPGQSTINGWNRLLDQLGYSALGKMWDNLGYVIAMLPDVIAGLFTGKTRNLQFKDNLLPVTAILMGLFLKHNPLLRMLLLGFGGISLLKKTGSAMVDAGLGRSPQSLQKVYKTYADEPLNPRMSGVAMKGNTMLCNIDGTPLVLTISDVAVDAYYKGKLPLNTLANAVLLKYDEHRGMLSKSFESGISTSMTSENRPIVIK